eukprot:TRINITY_DN79853_c0_g1_i1.p1 TRINITY_DN79853_c0_g1~~TRINITY_DN79853_c0_g1_i1.p1  ORF type:complete len:726 (-),score=164.46 TRINITY_DN79853_c0_g1_i1:300-2477(-)
MPKPQYALVADLVDTNNNLTEKVEATRKQIEQDIGGAAKLLRTDLSKLTDTVTANKKNTEKDLEKCLNDSKAYTDAQSDKTLQVVKGLLGTFEAQAAATQKDIDEKVVSLVGQVKQMMAEEIAVLCARLDNEFLQCRADFAAADEAKGQELLTHVANTAKDLQASIDGAANEAAKQLADKRSELLKALDDAVAAQKLADQQRDERQKQADNEIWTKVNELDKLLQGLTEKENDDITSTRRYVDDSIRNYADVADNRLNSLEKHAAKLQAGVTEVENLATRKVDWVIKNASSLLRPSSASKAGPTSWFSPRFDMGGAHGLQLELQLHRQTGTDSAEEHAGDVAIFLWACKGMGLVYKLYCGTKSETIEKVFNGRVPYGTNRFCFLKDHIDPESDTVRISCEMLEAVKEVQHIVKPPPSPEITDGMSIEEREAVHEARRKALESSLLVRRHVNNRLMDQVKSQVAAMQSRMTRKIEWRLEHASSLRKVFGPGETICSPAFAAAGVDGLQMIFYPCGYRNATEGFCSLYLYCPAGTTVRCNLFVGTQKRDTSGTYEQAGASGRNNFCRFDAGVDTETDSMTLALEVEEAHQHFSQMEVSQQSPHAGTLKLLRSSGKVNLKNDKDPLSDQRILPNLWTSKPLTEGTSDYSTFDEIANKAKRKDASGFGSAKSPQLESLQAPLPKLTKSRSAADWGHTGSNWTVGDAARGGRKARGGREAPVSPKSGTTV